MNLRSQERSVYAFELLRQYDIVDSTASNNSWYSQIKYIPLKEDQFITFGGSLRTQGESFINEEFNSAGAQDNFWILQRFSLHGKLKINKFEAFAELHSASVIGKDNPSPVDQDRLSFNQLFVLYRLTKSWSILAGRENLLLGSRRLVDLREGPNVRRSFDLIRLTYENSLAEICFFHSIPVINQYGVFDNRFLHSEESFSGIYTQWKLRRATGIDFYGFYQIDDEVLYNNGPENEQRYTTGIRLHSATNKWSYNHEFVYQFGSFGTQNISAWTLSLMTEYMLINEPYTVRLGLKTEAISGDKNPNDNRINTFDALYPRGAYFGRVARFGPSNLYDIHPYINVTRNKLFFEIDVDIFWRYSVEDAVYDAALQPVYLSDSNASLIGKQIGGFLGYEIFENFNLEVESNIIFPGAYLKESGFSDTLYHFVVTCSFLF